METGMNTSRRLYTILFNGAFNALDGFVRKASKYAHLLLRGDQLRAIAEIARRRRIIVRLDLYVEEGRPPAVGTGFFLSIPGSERDVIVTARHNLIQQGEDQPQLTPKIGIRLTDPRTQSQVTEYVTPDAYRISHRDKVSPSPTHSADDYGIILLDRPVVGDRPRPREAFGFNLVLAAMDLVTDQSGAVLPAQFGGYSGIRKDARLGAAPHFNCGAGTFGKYDERELYYHGETEQGMSGGPVWVNILGEEIVVGIHNEEEDKAGEGNRGIRLSIEVMQNICNWAGVSDGLREKALRVFDANPKGTPGVPLEGLFIQATLESDKSDCAEPLCYAWSGPTRNPALTTFDIILAQSSPTYSRIRNTSYIISHATSKRFLELCTNSDLAPKQVTLTEKLTRKTLLKLHQSEGSKKNMVADKTFNPKKPFRIMISQNHDMERLPKSEPYPDFKLTLWAEDIPPASDPFGLERARLGLIMRSQRYKTKPPCDFENFLLE